MILPPAPHKIEKGEPLTFVGRTSPSFLHARRGQVQVLEELQIYKTVPMLRIQCTVCLCKLTQLARHARVLVGLGSEGSEFRPLNFGRAAKARVVPALASMSDVDLHGSREQTALVYHCDSLLPPCQPPAPLSILPNHCDSCVALLMLFHRPLGPRSQCFLVDHGISASVSSCRCCWLSSLDQEIVQYIDFPFSCPHKPPSAPPISGLHAC